MRYRLPFVARPTRPGSLLILSPSKCCASVARGSIRCARRAVRPVNQGRRALCRAARTRMERRGAAVLPSRRPKSQRKALRKNPRCGTGIPPLAEPRARPSNSRRATIRTARFVHRSTLRKCCRYAAAACSGTSAWWRIPPRARRETAHHDRGGARGHQSLRAVPQDERWRAARARVVGLLRGAPTCASSMARVPRPMIPPAARPSASLARR